MAEQKRRQGQRGATPKPICPVCNEYMKRNYTREKIDGKWQYVGAGWSCPSVTCNYIIKDLVELEDEAEKGTEPDKLKKLTTEFMKTHEQLNMLAEQINALEGDKKND